MPKQKLSLPTSAASPVRSGASNNSGVLLAAALFGVPAAAYGGLIHPGLAYVMLVAEETHSLCKTHLHRWLPSCSEITEQTLGCCQVGQSLLGPGGCIPASAHSLQAKDATALIWQHPCTYAETCKAVAAGYRMRDLLPEPVGVHPSVSRLEMPAPWLAELSADLEEVMNAESLELQAIFNSDHLVRFLTLLALPAPAKVFLIGPDQG